MSLTDREIQELKNALSAKPKAVLVDMAVQHKRERDDQSLHTNAVQQDLEQSKLLQAVSIKRIDAELGGPYIRNLLVAVDWALKAGEALSSAPMENTMRVSRPDSSRDEGASTRRARKLKRSIKYHLERVTEKISSDLEYDPEIAEKRRDAAFYRHHKDGKHTEPRDGCAYCEEEAS